MDHTPVPDRKEKNFLDYGYLAGNVGAWEWDIVNDQLWSDSYVHEMLWASAEQREGGGTLAEFAACIHPDDREAVVGRMKTNASQGAAFIAEFRVCSARGDVRWVLARGRYELDEAGRPLRGRGILFDITGAHLSETSYDQQIEMPQACHPLERAADYCLSVRHVIAEANQPFLLKLTDMLLLELGRCLAGLARKERHIRIN
ncbi:PAS domain-containing protein [uncultured Methylobacterium sp.]|uniref:PAS domain-containing protein n=1 Tax=uncultured Methylobacterium sp. TaxID=157278 RepID=UPI002591FB33|nr:PAS domain-containing protein [uncultured Methylobacterium sp.]